MKPRDLNNIRIIFNKNIFNPDHNSSLYKKEIPSFTCEQNAHLTYFKFIQLVEEHFDKTDGSAINQNVLERKLFYNKLKVNLMDKAFLFYKNKGETISNISQENSTKLYGYVYDYLDESQTKSLNEKLIPYDHSFKYDEVDMYVDNYFRIIKKYFREHYFKLLLENTNKKRNKLLNKKKEKRKANDLYNKNSFIEDILSKYPFPAKMPKNSDKFNMFTFLQKHLEDPTFLGSFASQYDDVYENCNHSKIKKADFGAQTKDYLEQVSIYLFLLNFLISLDDTMLIRDFCFDSSDYYIIYESVENSPESLIAVFRVVKEKFIEIPISSEEINISDANRYIAFLEQIEKYFFSKLLCAFILTIGHEQKKDNTE